MDKHIPTHNKITCDKPSQQLFPKQVATQPSLLNQTNRAHKSVKIKTFKNWTAPNIKQMKPQRKYRLGTASNSYWGFIILTLFRPDTRFWGDMQTVQTQFRRRERGVGPGSAQFAYRIFYTVKVKLFTRNQPKLQLDSSKW